MVKKHLHACISEWIKEKHIKEVVKTLKMSELEKLTIRVPTQATEKDYLREPLLDCTNREHMTTVGK